MLTITESILQDIHTLSDMIERWRYTQNMLLSEMFKQTTDPHLSHGIVRSMDTILIHLDSARAALAFIDWKAGKRNEG